MLFIDQATSTLGALENLAGRDPRPTEPGADPQLPEQEPPPKEPTPFDPDPFPDFLDVPSVRPID